MIVYDFYNTVMSLASSRLQFMPIYFQRRIRQAIVTRHLNVLVVACDLNFSSVEFSSLLVDPYLAKTVTGSWYKIIVIIQSGAVPVNIPKRVKITLALHLICNSLNRYPTSQHSMPGQHGGFYRNRSVTCNGHVAGSSPHRQL